MPSEREPKNPYENAVCSHVAKSEANHVHTHACVGTSSEREELAKQLYDTITVPKVPFEENPDLWLHWADRLLPYIQQRVDAALATERAKVCTHCHLELGQCQNEKWETAIENRTRLNYRWEEDCKCFVIEFPRHLTQGRTLEEAIAAIKSVVGVTAWLLETGEMPTVSTLRELVDAAVQAEREKRVVLLREYGCHNPAVIYDPNAYCNADSSGSRREWKSGDEAFCNCGLAAAIRSGEKPTE